MEYMSDLQQEIYSRFTHEVEAKRNMSEHKKTYFTLWVVFVVFLIVLISEIDDCGHGSRGIMCGGEPLEVILLRHGLVLGAIGVGLFALKRKERK